METGTIVMMVLTFGTVWGGFIYLLCRLMKKGAGENEKPESRIQNPE